MRISLAQLESKVKELNKLAGTPIEPYSKDANGIYKANLGNYHLDGAYDGWRLVQLTSEAGAIKDIFGGYISKRALYDQISSFISGLKAGAGKTQY